MNEYDCKIIANNNTDFVIAKDVKPGKVPLLIGGYGFYVDWMNFDIKEYFKKNSLFKINFEKTRIELKMTPSLKEKFEKIQGFIENFMPLCKPENMIEREYAVFDREAFSYMMEHQLCVCIERATLAQYLCQKSEIKSYLVNSFVHIKNGEKGPHAYIVFEDGNNMFVYDPANPVKGGGARIMAMNMDKTIFADFIDAVNYNADCKDIKQKNRVGFVCEHEDGKKFLYYSSCGTEENTIGPKKLKENRLIKIIQNQHSEQIN